MNANEVQAGPGCDIGCCDFGVRWALTAGTVNYLARERTRLLGLFPASLEGRDIMAAEIRSVKAHLAAAEQAFARLRPGFSRFSGASSARNISCRTSSLGNCTGSHKDRKSTRLNSSH